MLHWKNHRHLCKGGSKSGGAGGGGGGGANSGLVNQVEQVLRENPYIAGSDTDQGGGWQRVKAGVDMVKSGEWTKMTTEDKVSFFETMGNVTPPVSKKSGSPISNASIQLQDYMYKSLPSSEKNKIAQGLVDGRFYSSQLKSFADHANPALKAIGRDVESRMDSYRKSKKTRSSSSSSQLSGLEDLFG